MQKLIASFGVPPPVLRHPAIPMSPDLSALNQQLRTALDEFHRNAALLYGKAGWQAGYGSIAGRVTLANNGNGVSMASVVAIAPTGPVLVGPDQQRSSIVFYLIVFFWLLKFPETLLLLRLQDVGLPVAAIVLVLAKPVCVLLYSANRFTGLPLVLEIIAEK